MQQVNVEWKVGTDSISDDKNIIGTDTITMNIEENLLQW